MCAGGWLWKRGGHRVIVGGGVKDGVVEGAGEGRRGRACRPTRPRGASPAVRGAAAERRRSVPGRFGTR